MAETEMSTIYLVDSFGAICSEQIEYQTGSYIVSFLDSMVEEE